MTREEYLQHRNQNSMYPVYVYYKEKAKDKILSVNDFFRFFQMWPNSQEVIQEIYDFYDFKFEVMKIGNKNGVYFKYI